VLAGSQVVAGSHTGVHLGPADTGRRNTRPIHIACFVVWQPHHVADTLTISATELSPLLHRERGTGRRLT